MQLDSHELAEVDREEQQLRDQFMPLVLNNLSGTSNLLKNQTLHGAETAVENERLRQFGLKMITGAGPIHEVRLLLGLNSIMNFVFKFLCHIYRYNCTYTVIIVHYNTYNFHLHHYCIDVENCAEVQKGVFVSPLIILYNVKIECNKSIP